MARASYDPLLLGAEHYLPSWHVARTERDGLAHQLLLSLALEAESWQSGAARAQFMHWLGEAPLALPRLSWSCAFPFRREEELQVELTVGEATQPIPAATSPSQFTLTTGPVYWIDPASGRLRLRNLAVRDQEVDSSTGSYAVSGEAAGFVPDAAVYWRADVDAAWQTLAPDDARISGTTLTLPVTGTVTVRYASQATLSALATGTVVVRRHGARTPPLVLVQEEEENYFDAWGALLSLPRFPAEDNRAYRDRLLAHTQSPPGVDRGAVLRGLAARLGLFRTKSWNGIDALTLPDSAEETITSVRVLGVDRYRAVEEELLPAPGDPPHTVFYAAYGDWRSDWRVYVDGIPQEGVTVSGSVVTLARGTSGVVTAEYSLEQYTLTRSGVGYQTLVAGQGIPSGSYLVLYTQEVDAHALDLPAVQEALLLGADGVPNELFRELYGRLQSESPVACGRSGWGYAYWFAPEEPQPEPTHLPIPMDRHLAG